MTKVSPAQTQNKYLVEVVDGLGHTYYEVIFAESKADARNIAEADSQVVSIKQVK